MQSGREAAAVHSPVQLNRICDNNHSTQHKVALNTCLAVPHMRTGLVTVHPPQLPVNIAIHCARLLILCRTVHHLNGVMRGEQVGA